MLLKEVKREGTTLERALCLAAQHVARPQAAGKGLSFKNALLLPETILRGNKMFRVSEVFGTRDARELRAARFGAGAEKFPIWAPRQDGTFGPTYVADVVDTDAAEGGFRGFPSDSRPGLAALLAKKRGFTVVREHGASGELRGREIVCEAACEHIMEQVVFHLSTEFLGGGDPLRCAMAKATAFEVARFAGETPAALGAETKATLLNATGEQVQPIVEATFGKRARRPQKGGFQALAGAHRVAAAIADRLCAFAREYGVKPIYAPKDAAVRTLAPEEIQEWKRVHEVWKAEMRKQFRRDDIV